MRLKLTAKSLAAMSRRVVGQPLPREKDVLGAIKAYLESKSWLVIRCNSGMRVSVYKGKRHVFRANSEPGCADLICCSPEGKFVAVECKRPGAGMTIPQLQFQQKVRRAGGVAIVATSIEDVMEALR